MHIPLKILALVLIQTIQAKRKDYDVMGHRGIVGFLRSNLDNHRVRVGQDIAFTCQVENIGNYKVAWLHSEKGIIAVHPDVLGQNERIKSTHDNRDSWTLIIKSVQESDAGKYICQVNTEVSMSISGTLSVEVPPDIIDEVSSSDTLVQEGMRVTLSCESTGVPKPTITWRRESKHDDDREGEQIRLCNKTFNNRLERWEETCHSVDHYVGDVLQLHNVNRFDSGVYLCIAKNNVPPSVSKRVQLYVDYPPTLSVFHQLVGKVKGHNATLECLSSGHPPPFHFWKKDGAFVTNRDGKYSIEEGVALGAESNKFTKLSIINIKEEDFGRYQCQAKNSLGETSGNIRLYEIIVSTLPSTDTTLHQSQDVIREDYDSPWGEYGVVTLSQNNKRRRKEEKRRDRQRDKHKLTKSENSLFAGSGASSPAPPCSLLTLLGLGTLLWPTPLTALLRPTPLLRTYSLLILLSFFFC